MKFFILSIFIFSLQILHAQEGLNTIVLPVDTTNIAQAITEISAPKDSITDTIQSKQDSLRAVIQTIFNEENIDYNDPITKADSIIVGLTDSAVAIIDSTLNNDTLQVKQVIQEQINSPENISITNATTIESKIYKNTLKDLSIENSTIITLIIDETTIGTATLTSCSITKLIIRNSSIEDFLIEDSAIGEISVENTKIQEFETNNAFIKKQVIVSGKSNATEEKVEE